MKFLSLFAGIGGFDLGLERAGMECVGQVEIDDFCNRVLGKHWPNIKRIKDVHDVTGTEFGTIGLICGGIPCQPASSAGKRRGTADDRWLWPEAFRMVRAIKPTWCLFENVCGLTSLEQGMVFDNLLSKLENEGYEVQPFIIPACAVDAKHQRKRVWIIARRKNVDDTKSWRCGFSRTPHVGQAEGIVNTSGDTGQVVADTNCQWTEQGYKTSRESFSISRSGCRWLPEPDVGRVAYGVSRRVDRLRALGNAVVPQVVEIIGRAILEAEKLYA